MNEQTYNVLQNFWRTGELPVLETKVVFDDKSLLKIVLALMVVMLVAFLLFKIAKVKR